MVFNNYNSDIRLQSFSFLTHMYEYDKYPLKELHVKIIRIMIYTLIATHWFACFWYYVGWKSWKNNDDNWLHSVKLDMVILHQQTHQ